MDDLISRQAAIEAVLDMNAEHRVSWKDTVIDIINELPSAQPEIIRCKDCKHYQFADNRAFGMPVKMCEWFGFEDVDDFDFCSRAERITDEN